MPFCEKRCLKIGTLLKVQCVTTSESESTFFSPEWVTIFLTAESLSSPCLLHLKFRMDKRIIHQRQWNESFFLLLSRKWKVRYEFQMWCEMLLSALLTGINKTITTKAFPPQRRSRLVYAVTFLGRRSLHKTLKLLYKYPTWPQSVNWLHVGWSFWVRELD